jgi:hypothetical protein
MARSAFSVPAPHIVPRSIRINDHCSIASLLEKKHLKTIYNCHACSGTLDGSDMDGDHDLTVLDIDFIIH